MPVQNGRDSKGCWMRWGNRGPKRYYKCGNAAARERAKRKVDMDRRRIEYFKHKKK